jgi:hypothetical protein
MVRGPIMAEVTPGWLIANAMAMWVSLKPAWSATGMICSTASRRRSSGHVGPALQILLDRAKPQD